MVFHGSLSDTRTPQVSKNFLCILAVLNNAGIQIVSTCLPTSKSSSPFNNSFVTIPKAPITIGMILTRMFYSFFQFPSMFDLLFLLFTFFQFYSVVSRDIKGDNLANSHFFFFCRLLLGLVFLLRLGVPCVCQRPKGVYESSSRTDAELCIYHLFVWSNSNFLHISQWITLLTQSCLVLYSFCSNLLHSLIMWLMVSSLSPHSLHLLFCCILSILTLIWSVLEALFCTAIRRDSVSLLKFPCIS